MFHVYKLTKIKLLKLSKEQMYCKLNSKVQCGTHVHKNFAEIFQKITVYPITFKIIKTVCNNLLYAINIQNNNLKTLSSNYLIGKMFKL